MLTGGGGYELLEVVPRTWTHLLAEAAGSPIDPGARIPAAWREYASRRTGREAPQTMTDGTEPEFARFESGYDLADRVDQAIMATRTAVFPEHGLMPGTQAGPVLVRAGFGGVSGGPRAGSGPARTAPEAVGLQCA